MFDSLFLRVLYLNYVRTSVVQKRVAAPNARATRSLSQLPLFYYCLPASLHRPTLGHANTARVIFFSSPQAWFFYPSEKNVVAAPSFFLLSAGCFFFTPPDMVFFYPLRFFFYPSKECFVGGKVD